MRRVMLAAIFCALMAPAGLGPVRPASAAACDAAACVTPHDVIPNFGAAPTIRSVRDGAWSAPATWTPARLPGPTDIVQISAGTTVSHDHADGRARVVAIQAGAALQARSDIATRLTVGTLLVLPQGRLQIGSAAAPIAPAVTAELVIADTPLDLSDDGIGVFDPRQFGTGLLAVDGAVTLHGAPRTPFVRLAAEPRAGDLTLSLAQPVSGWRPGDRLFLPDSKQYASESGPYAAESEEVVVASVAAGGASVALVAPVRFAHPGARDGDGRLEFLPHVGNLSRNVIVRSENPAGVRGHVLLTGRAAVDIRYADLRNLGRTTIDPLDSATVDGHGHVTHIGTNQIGRYPLHIHHVMGPVATPANGHQFTLVGNAVDDDDGAHRRKWAITVHDSHHGLIQDNVVYNAAGWGIGTEDGNESFNLFAHNFVARVRGVGGRANAEQGLGYWFRGPHNYVRDNVAANVMGVDSPVDGLGFNNFFVYLGDICVPLFKGADVAVAGQYRLANGNALPLLEFAGNEAYGSTATGLEIWWLGTLDTAPLTVAESVVKDFRVWHHSRYGYYGYPANRLTFDGFVARGDQDVIANRHEFVLGIWFGDYMNQDVVIRNADIQGLRTGINPPYFMRNRTIIENSYLRNATNIAITTIGAPGSAPYGPDMPPKETIIRNVRFATVNGPVGGNPQHAIAMDYTLHGGSANLVKRDAVFVYDFNQTPGDTFQVFYHEQRPDFVVPRSNGNLAGSPEAGLTNAQNWAKHGLAIAGEVAVGAGPRAGIDGLVRVGAPPPPTTSPPANTGATAWYFAEGYTGPGFDEYLTLQNPNGQAAAIAITYYLNGGAPIVKNVAVPANSRATVAVHDPALGVGRGREVAAKVESTNGVGVVAERPMYFTYSGATVSNVTGGHNVMGVQQPRQTWLFGEGYTGAGFDEYLTILNPNAAPAPVTITYYLGGGQAPVVKALTVPANARYTVTVHDPREGVGRGHEVSARVETTLAEGIVVERPIYFRYAGSMGAVTGGHNVMGAASPRPAWFFPDGATAAGWDMYLTLLNPAGQDSQVRLTYYVAGEPTPRTKAVVAPRNARTTVVVHDAAQGVGRGHTLGVKVETTNGVDLVVERPIYFRYSPTVNGGHDAMGAAAAKASWLFAEGYTGAGFDQYLIVLNPHATAAPATITYYLNGGGAPITRTLTVAPYSRAAVAVFDAGHVGRGKEVSAKVETTHAGGVVVERPIYFAYGGSMDGGHTAMGFTP
jgi:hypothetical protein